MTRIINEIQKLIPKPKTPYYRRDNTRYFLKDNKLCCAMGLLPYALENMPNKAFGGFSDEQVREFGLWWDSCKNEEDIIERMNTIWI